MFLNPNSGNHCKNVKKATKFKYSFVRQLHTVSLVKFRRFAVSMKWSAVVQKPGDSALAYFPWGRFFDPGMGLSGRRILIPSVGPGSFPLTAVPRVQIMVERGLSLLFSRCSY
jgi:hypothetical protein